MKVQKVAQALIVGGIATLAIGLIISLLIGYVVKGTGVDSVAGQLTYIIGAQVAGVVFGVGFPLTIVGVVLAWVSRPELDAEELDDTGEVTEAEAEEE